jgi:hypothetical protein
MKLKIVQSMLAAGSIALLSGLFVLSVRTDIAVAAPYDDISEDDLIAKHLASIGTEEALKGIKSITIVGTSKAVLKGRGSGETSGVVILASQGESNLIGMKFDNSDYPFEKMGYNGDEFTVGFIRPGVRSVLGEFLRINENSFKVGILGGALSTSWELLDYDPKAGKLRCSGTKEIDGNDTYKCRYNPRKGSDLKIDLYFDSKTFRHVRTEYSRIIAARQGASIDTSARQSETRYKMVEEFSGFREENGLTLPHRYVMYLEILAGNGTTSYEWTMDLSRFDFNNEIDPKEFKVDTY